MFIHSPFPDWTGMVHKQIELIFRVEQDISIHFLWSHEKVQARTPAPIMKTGQWPVQMSMSSMFDMIMWQLLRTLWGGDSYMSCECIFILHDLNYESICIMNPTTTYALVDLKLYHPSIASRACSFPWACQWMFGMPRNLKIGWSWVVWIRPFFRHSSTTLQTVPMLRFIVWNIFFV